ncbi:sulfite exporter TauE/SafE family protein [soil metagenome]
MSLDILLALLAVFAGAVIQGSVGFGFSLTTVPTLALVRPEALPVTILCLAIPMTGFMALNERRAINLPAFAWITGGRVPGTVVGAGLLAIVPDNSLARFLGLFIILAVLTSFVGPTFSPTRIAQLTGGLVSGIMSTAAALGGPPLALVNQRSSGPKLRSTLALSFLVGIIMSLTVLAVTGHVAIWHFFLALKLLPPLILGLLSSHWITGLLDERWLRPAVLSFAAVSGLFVLVSGSLG